jgi:DNA end-binding protein Ku
VASAHDEQPSSGQVIDLMEALRASLGKKAASGAPAKSAKAAEVAPALGLGERKGVKRAPKVDVEEAAPAKARARK